MDNFLDRASAALHWLVVRWHLSQVPPWWVVVLVTAVVVAATVVNPVWRVIRPGMTVVHEMGHAVVAWLCGRRVASIALHTDTSGLTISSGKPRGLGMLLTMLGGYTAPPLVGLALVWASDAGWSGAALTVVAFLLVAAFWLSRNLFGLLVVSAALLAAGLVWWQGDAGTVTVFVLAVGIFLLVAGIRGTLDVWAAHRRGEGESSDAAQAAQHSLLPAAAWLVFFFATAVVCAAQAGLVLIAHLT